MQRSLPQTPVSLLETWKAALTWVKGVGGVSGWVHDPNTQSEAELVDKVIANILDALTITRALPSLAGVDFRIEELINSPGLRLDEPVRMLGLTGMGGIGKTTLATALYNRLLPHFPTAHCFLADVRSQASATGLQSMQQQLLRDLCGWKDAPLTQNVQHGVDLLSQRLGGHKAEALPLLRGHGAGLAGPPILAYLC
ncbi:hypothetical protein WJX72_012331 [[Myrmecia] bisecta]|uniref:NB-ARC domain-containing protein n=1 Tax=[Myrmecia] bisecta TaxID=41462 RepID=A0AAW1PQJ7_9CHLO